MKSTHFTCCLESAERRAVLFEELRCEERAAPEVLLRSDGRVVVVGAVRAGQARVPALPEAPYYAAAAAGVAHTVLLRSDGVAKPRNPRRLTLLEAAESARQFTLSFVAKTVLKALE